MNGSLKKLRAFGKRVQDYKQKMGHYCSYIDDCCALRASLLSLVGNDKKLVIKIIN